MNLKNFKGKKKEFNVVPKYVTILAEAYEQGKIVMGGWCAGRTWAMRIATAKRHSKVTATK